MIRFFPLKCIFVLSLLLLLVITLGACRADQNHAASSDEHEAVKTRVVAADRPETPADAQFHAGMHISYIGLEESPYADGAYLYHTLRVTGDAIGEEQIYSLRELEELASLGLKNQAAHALGLNVRVEYPLEQIAFEDTGEDVKRKSFVGLDLLRFLELCGLSKQDPTRTQLQFYTLGEAEPSHTVLLADFLAASEAAPQTPAILAFGLAGQAPLVPDDANAGYDDSYQNKGGPLVLLFPQADGTIKYIKALNKITAGSDAGRAVPFYYWTHDREPYRESLEIPFAIHVYEAGGESESAPVNSKVFTTAQLEQLALANPEQVFGNYYGLIGDRYSSESMGLGSWLDYFEGLDLLWLLQSQLDLKNWSGYALLYDREGLVYTRIQDLQYLANPGGDYSGYTITTREGVHIPGARPLLAYAKNGYPLLPEHDHESAGYHDYNQLNRALAAAGVMTEIGAVKNHNGPFVACLGNVDGYYGGYQVETAGDCVRIDLYLNPTNER